MDPINACELEFGMPKYQVPRFHTIAATSSANTIEKPRRAAYLQNQFHRQQRYDAERDCAARDQHTNKVQGAGIDHRQMRFQRVRIDDRSDSIGRIVEAVDEFKPKRNQQCNTEQQRTASAESAWSRPSRADQNPAGVDRADHQRDPED